MLDNDKCAALADEDTLRAFHEEGRLRLARQAAAVKHVPLLMGSSGPEGISSMDMYTEAGRKIIRDMFLDLVQRMGPELAGRMFARIQ